MAYGQGSRNGLLTDYYVCWH